MMVMVVVCDRAADDDDVDEGVRGGLMMVFWCVCGGGFSLVGVVQ